MLDLKSLYLLAVISLMLIDSVWTMSAKIKSFKFQETVSKSKMPL